MNPHHFPEAAAKFHAPEGMAESQVATIPACRTTIQNPNSSCDGAPIIITAWKPNAEEIQRIAAGEPIYLTFLGHGLPPHFPSLSFEEAKNPR